MGQTAQDDFEIRQISLKDGLSNQVITSVCSGKKGQLWIGTQNGLYSYDGFRVTRYDNAERFLQNLPDTYITDIEIADDSSGILFVCTRNGARAIDPILRQNIPDWNLGIKDGMLGRCTQIEKSRDGYFFGYSAGMMYKINPVSKDRFVMYPWFETIKYPLVKMVADPDHPDAVWLLPNTSGTWYTTPLRSKRIAIQPIQNNLPELKGLTEIFYAGKGLFGWDMAWNFYRFDEKAQEWRLSDNLLYNFFPAMKPVETLRNQKLLLNDSRQLVANQQGLCTNSGLFIVRKKSDVFKTIPVIKNKDIRSIFTDNSGNWWASTFNGMYSGNIQSASTRFQPDIKGVWGFLPMPNDSCLLAFEMGNGIGKWDFHSDYFEKFTILNASKPGMNVQHVLSFCKDFQGNIWAGTFRELLHNSMKDPSFFQPFSDPVSHRLFEQPQIRVLLADSDSSIWIGAENGLYRLLYNVSKRRYEPDPESPYAKGTVVNDLYQDRFGNLWIATKGSGVACRYKKGHWRWLTIDNGLSNNVACCIKGSNEDRVIWISTHHGLSRFDIAQSHFCNFYEENGLPSDEFEVGASSRLKDGTLFFGGLNGIVYFDPDSVPTIDFDYKTIITSVLAYNSRQDTLVSFFTGADGLSLWPYPEYVEILLGSNEYIRRDKIIFRYRMKGISDNWNFTNGERDIKYFKLPPGQYLFEVEVRLPSGQYGLPATLKLTILTPFYQTWWFIILLVAAVILMVHKMYRLRVNRVLKEQVIRQQIADDLHDDIGNKLNIISILTQKVARIYEPVDGDPQLSVLQKLVGVSREALVSLHTMIWTVDPSKDKVADLLTRMEDFAADYLYPLNITCVFRLPPVIPDREISLKVRHHLILIYQELLTNMIKHSPPSQLTFHIALLDSGTLEIEILNEHPAKMLQYDTLSANRGLESMKRRLNRINGVLKQVDITEALQKINLVVSNIYKN